MKNKKMEFAPNFNENGTMIDQNVFVPSKIVELSKLTKMPVRKGLERAIVCEGQIVNVVSNQYGHLPNEEYFYKVEEKLIMAGIKYQTRSINRENRAFAVDYILNDDSFHIDVKTGKGIDNIKPMMRFTNSYDGTVRTSGHFGFFRKVCANGMHVAHQNIGFSVKHKGNMIQVVMPELDKILEVFMKNEFYELRKKFNVLAERPIKDLNDFVKITAEHFKLFKFEASETNKKPSMNARLVLEVIEREAKLLNSKPNLWLGYNAFNEVLHGKLKKTFEQQKNLDTKIFDYVLEMA